MQFVVTTEKRWQNIIFYKEVFAMVFEEPIVIVSMFKKSDTIVCSGCMTKGYDC